MIIHYDPKDPLDRTFCEWVNRNEQTTPLTCTPSTTALTNQARIQCLAALPEYRGWATLLQKQNLTQFTKKVCTHLIANRKTLPETIFRHPTKEIAQALKKLPPKPAAAIAR